MGKIKLLLFLFGVVIVFNSCEQGAEPLFFVEVERDFDLPSSLNTIETHFFQLKAVPTLLDANLNVNNMTLDDVMSIGPGDASLSSSFGNVDWTFIQTVEIWMISRFDSSKRARVFYSDQPDFSNRNSINMFNTFAEIKDIISEGLIDLEVRIKTRNFVPGSVQPRLKFTYAVYDEL